MLSMSFILIVFASGGYLLKINNYNRKLLGELVSYEVQKESIQNSINNSKLSGLERINLVKQANKLNEWLAIKKSEINKFTFINMNNKNKQKIRELSFIDLLDK